jgi:NhaP-type Na+/H+ or K+/H+ antiporter
VQPVLLGLASILILGVSAQWLAWRLRLPSLLLLLAFGFLAGPVTGLLHPDALFQSLLLPLVSLFVAVILYEGGLSLKLRDLRDVGAVFIRLVTLGTLLTWAISAMAASVLLRFDWPLAALLGAILVVTGPTVIGPLLRHLRLGGRVGSILRWEGIVIDPIGAMLAVLVFTAVGADRTHEAIAEVIVEVVRTVVVGGGLGMAGAALLTVALRRFWVPDPLHNAVSLMLVVAVYTVANMLQKEAGLFAVTVMGIGLANQRWVTVHHLVEFKENLTVLLVSSLFIILAARLQLQDLAALDLESVAFLLVLILFARPAAVLVATAGSPLEGRERLFLAWMAPRGIVAAAVSSIFALEMTASGYTQAGRMVPVTFLVIVGTVALYGLTAAPLARRLGLTRPDPQGVLFVGAHAWARELGAALQTSGCPVLLVDSDWANVSAARLQGLPVHYGSILAEHTLSENDFGVLKRLVALTPNDEVNALACLRFIEVFGRREVYQLPFRAPGEGRREAVPLEQRGRLLFGANMTHAHLLERFGDQPTLRATTLTPEFDFDAFRAHYGDAAASLALLRRGGEVVLFTVDAAPVPKPGDVVISVVTPEHVQPPHVV